MNDKYILASFPDDTFPENLSSFQKVREEVRPLRDDEVLIQVLYISIDPVARVWVSGAKTYLPAIKLGGEIPGFCVGKVVATTSELHSKNDLVFGVLSWSSYVIRKAHMVFPVPDVIKSLELGPPKTVPIPFHFGTSRNNSIPSNQVGNSSLAQKHFDRDIECCRGYWHRLLPVRSSFGIHSYRWNRWLRRKMQIRSRTITMPRSCELQDSK